MRTGNGWLGVLALAVGCTSPVQISRQAREPASVFTEDGLYRVEATQVGVVYLRPGASFATFDEVVFDPCTLAYKSPPVARSIFRREIGNYLLDLDNSDRVTRAVRMVLVRELDGRGDFRVVAEEGPNVLRVSCQIVDLVWETPDAMGGETYWVKRTGVMTLVLSVRDSESGTVLARIADRMAIRPGGASLAGGYENRPVNNWAGVRHVSRRWARIFREALEALQGFDI